MIIIIMRVMMTPSDSEATVAASRRRRDSDSESESHWHLPSRPAQAAGGCQWARVPQRPPASLGPGERDCQSELISQCRSPLPRPGGQPDCPAAESVPPQARTRLRVTARSPP